MGQRTKTDGRRPALAVSPLVEESKEQAGFGLEMPLTKRHNKGRKPLVLPVAGKVGDLAPQARAENGHVQSEVILLI